MRYPKAHPSEPRWRRARRVLTDMPPSGVREWLLDASSLTQRLRERCPDQLRVELLDQTWGRPLPSECRALRLRRGEWALVRQVRLVCGDEPWVYARTVIPTRTLSRRPALGRLGERPLGAVLFADRAVSRDGLEIARIRPGERLADDELTLWGRRSVFRVDDRPLLVTEVFLSGERQWQAPPERPGGR